MEKGHGLWYRRYNYTGNMSLAVNVTDPMSKSLMYLNDALLYK